MAQIQHLDLHHQRQTDDDGQNDGPSPETAYQRELLDLKALMTKALEKKGVLARIKAEIRASIFETLEESDRGATPEEPKALLGTCSEQAALLHKSKPGRILAALVAEYLDWAGADHTLRLYIAECNLPQGTPRRGALAEELGLLQGPGPAAKPLLQELLEAHLERGDKAHVAGAGSAAAAAAAAAQSIPLMPADFGTNLSSSSSVMGRSTPQRPASPTRAPPSSRSSSPFSRGLSPFSRGSDRDSKHSHRKGGREDHRPSSSGNVPASMLRDHH